MAEELNVLSDFYDFMLWLTQRIEKFPRHHRYSLGTSMEKRLQELLALLLRAKFRKNKAEYLKDANVELEILRFQLRLAGDLRAMPAQSQGHAVKRMAGIGMQIGGWLRQGAFRKKG